MKKAVIAAVVLVLAVGLAVFVWQRIRTSEKASGPAESYMACLKAKDSTVRESYPEVCATAEGQSFVNPEQQVFQPPSEGVLPPR